MTREISIAFQTDKPLAAYGPLAETAEAYGFDGVTVYNDMLYQPAWLPLLEMARATRRVRLGPAAVNTITCHPINIAGNIALIDEASDGRAYLGLARGSWLDFVGIEPERPVTALRETMECVRHLLNRSTAPYEGQVFKLAGGDSLRWPISRSNIPFLLGTWGARTIQACIREIAEVKIGGSSNPAMVRSIRSVIADAAKEAGRDPGSIGIVIGAVTIVDRDGEAAKKAVRRQAALYLPVIAPLDSTLNIEPELLAHISEAAGVYDYERAGSYIPDDILRRVAFAGTPDEVAEQAQDLFAAGVTRVEFGTPHGLSTEEGMRLLGEQVLPAVRE